jgi:iron complex outermembrane receptor protein
MFNIKPIALSVAVACLSLSTENAYAQQNVQNTDEQKTEVVVTATRNEKAIDKIPGAISVISQQELSSQYLIADDPSQALATFIPGYAPSRQKMTSSGESLRGRQPLILLDGIPQSNPLRAGMREGYFADSFIIERIEVINGASAVQGMGATGGIINYITKTPRKNGTHYGINVRAATQFKSDNIDWKTGYSITHKSDDVDLLGYAALQKRGMSYDGSGRRLGIDTIQGDTLDTQGNDLFFKIGKNFGTQRLQLSINRFKLEGDGDYKNMPGSLELGIPTSALPGIPLGSPPRNNVRSTSLDYRFEELAGGSLSAQVFKHDFTSLYGASITPQFQDSRIAEQGKLVDQAQIIADKLGARITYVRPDTLIKGLEVTTGMDLLKDHTQQSMLLTNRVWVPLLKFNSIAPFAQLEFERGPFTVRGGLRHEIAKLNVDTYTTLATYGSRQVQGGSAEFNKTIKNLGAIWRIAPQWSTFVASSEGFGLPDVGLVLRSVSTPGKSVSNLINLQPIITRNNEIGINWRGSEGQFSISSYDSSSKLGSVLRVDSAGIGHVARVPTTVKGWEVSGEWRPSKPLSLSASYAKINGKTAASQGSPMDISLGARGQGPNKTVLAANWKWIPTAQLRVQATHLFDRDINIGRQIGTTKLEEHFKGYTLVDAAVTMDTRYGKLGVSIENVLNKHYISYFSQTVAATDPGNTYAGRGRTLAINWSRMF